MAGFCNGGDAWRSYVHEATDNKGSNFPFETWEKMDDVGSFFFRDRLWRPGYGERSFDDVSYMRGRGFFNGMITTPQWHDTDRPIPLRTATQWRREHEDLLLYYFAIYGCDFPVAPWNENIDHTDAVAAGPAIFTTLLDDLGAQFRFLVPAAAVNSPDEKTYYAAMAPAYRDPRTAGICVHVRENNFHLVDDFRSAYPDKLIYVSEFGFENVENESQRIRLAEEFVLKWLPDRNIVGVGWFTLRCKNDAWAKHYQTAAEYANWKKLCVWWRQKRLTMATLLVSSPVNGDDVLVGAGGVFAAKYRSDYLTWVNAGGVRNNYAKHVYGRQMEPVDDAAMDLVTDEGIASANQIAGAWAKLKTQNVVAS